jgi:hypothetical protein
MVAVDGLLDQHWQIFTDKDDGIIGPDGQPLKVDSIVPGCPDGQLVAVIDSGCVHDTRLFTSTMARPLEPH